MAKMVIDPIKVTRDYIKHLAGKKLIKISRVILFGSAAAGKMHRDSDLDIIVLSPDFKNMDYISRLQLLSRAREDKFTFVPMDILGYTLEEFEKMAHPDQSIVLSEAKRKGKVIYEDRKSEM